MSKLVGVQTIARGDDTRQGIRATIRFLRGRHRSGQSVLKVTACKVDVTDATCLWGLIAVQNQARPRTTWGRPVIVLSFVVVTLIIVTRFFVDEPAQRLMYGILMCATGAAGLAASRRGRANRNLPASWHRYTVLASAGLVAGSLDGFLAALGQRRIGFVVAAVIAIPGVVVYLRSALHLERVDLEDGLDALLIACGFAYLIWWYHIQPDQALLQQVILFAFVISTATFAALIVFAARDLQVVRPRALTALGLAMQPAGILLAPEALSAARYADNLVGSSVTLLGVVSLVAAMVVARTTPVLATDVEGNRSDAWWWGPMALSLGLFLTHTGLGRTPLGNTTVVNGLLITMSLLLMARMVTTVKVLQQASTKLKFERELFRRRALTDPLTGLANRSALSQHLRAALQSASPTTPVAVLFCDIDRLKVVNDSLGHDVGDELITAVARRWSAVMGPATMLARVGGDEFVVVCTEGGQADLSVVAARMHEALADPFALAGQHLSSNVSIGAAIASDSTMGSAEILRDADAAMYEAKAAGGGTTRVFDESIHHRAVRRLMLERHLREAIREEDVAVALQPIIALRTGSVCGVETLLRWNHPQLGAIDPPSVISVAEETGLIVPLGQVILNKSLIAFRTLTQAGHSIPMVSVNTSASQLTTPGFATAVLRCLRDHDVPPVALKLEVTESVLLDTDGPAADALAALVEMGVSISMDDFGTGYSSLSYLGRMEIEELKMDGTFMDAINNPGGLSVVQGIIDIAHNIGVSVVAERIETREQLEQLRLMECDRGQGYLFCKPLPVHELDRWLGTRDPSTDLLWQATA